MQATCCVSSLSLSLTSPESSCVPQTGPQLCPHIWLEMSTYSHEIFQPRTSLEVFLFTDNLLWCTEGLMRLAKWQISQGTLLSLWCNSHLARFRESRGSFHGCAGDCRFQKRFYIDTAQSQVYPALSRAQKNVGVYFWRWLVPGFLISSSSGFQKEMGFNSITRYQWFHVTSSGARWQNSRSPFWLIWL